MFEHGHDGSDLVDAYLGADFHIRYTWPLHKDTWPFFKNTFREVLLCDYGSYLDFLFFSVSQLLTQRWERPGGMFRWRRVTKETQAEQDQSSHS